MRGSSLLLPLVWIWSASGAIRAGTEPAKIGYSEEVRVRLIQLEVTVWPPADDPGRCLGLTQDDFRLTVNGKPRSIEAVDWLGSFESIRAEEGVSAADPARPPMKIVLFFDLWHLNVFQRAGFDCPITKPLAFEEARRMVREEFVSGDGLLLVTFAGWPRVHDGWIRDPGQALAALDRLEVSPFVLSARQEHLDHQPWFDGMESLLLALGRYPGPKELIYLGDDFRFDELILRVQELAGRAQANHVTFHAVDLVAACRTMPGPGCPFTVRGGLGCTPWSVPVALGPMAWNTGGQLFRSSSIGAAVRRIREMRACRYMVSFSSDPQKERKVVARAIVSLNRKGLTLRAPVGFQNPDRPPAEREQQDALFLLPRFGQGLLAETGLWALRPSEKKKKRWSALLLVRLRRAPGEPWPEDLAEIVVDAAALGGSKIYGEFRKVLVGEELSSLRDSDEPRLLVFRVADVRSGEATVAVRARGTAPGGEVVANVRGSFAVPEPPGPGEARPWYLTDRLARVGSTVTLLPSLDGLLAPGREALVVGYGCGGKERFPGEGGGRLVALGDGASANVPIAWLDGTPPVEEGGCGWLVGRIGPDLEPGLWRFEPPGSVSGGVEAGASVEFRVAGTEGSPASNLP